MSGVPFELTPTLEYHVPCLSKPLSLDELRSKIHRVFMAIRGARYQYRDCEIRVEVMGTSWNNRFWEGRAYINYIKDGVARTESCFGEFNTYRSKEEAEQQVLEKAKLWVDSVLFER